MKISQRETVLILTTLAVVMFGATALVAKPKWEKLSKIFEEQQSVRSAIELDRAMSEQKEQWERKYHSLSKKLSRFPADKKMDLHWRGQLNKVAARTGMKIVRLDPTGEEDDLGQVKELALTCKLWEGDLSSLTRFLFDLETGNDMFDMRRLRISKPRGNKATLTGLFSLYCAYMREDGVSPDAAPESNGR